MGLLRTIYVLDISFSKKRENQKDTSLVTLLFNDCINCNKKYLSHGFSNSPFVVIFLGELRIQVLSLETGDI